LRAGRSPSPQGSPFPVTGPASVASVVERLWRSVKYEHVYLHAYESVTEARERLAGYFEFYNGQRPHSSLGARTPDAAYFDSTAVKLAA
jgi:putative transposase